MNLHTSLNTLLLLASVLLLLLLASSFVAHNDVKPPEVVVAQPSRIFLASKCPPPLLIITDYLLLCPCLPAWRRPFRADANETETTTAASFIIDPDFRLPGRRCLFVRRRANTIHTTPPRTIAYGHTGAPVFGQDAGNVAQVGPEEIALTNQKGEAEKQV